MGGNSAARRIFPFSGASALVAQGSAVQVLQHVQDVHDGAGSQALRALLRGDTRAGSARRWRWHPKARHPAGPDLLFAWPPAAC